MLVSVNGIAFHLASPPCVRNLCVSDTSARKDRNIENYFSIAHGRLIWPAKNAKDFFVLSLMLVTVVLLRETGISDGTARDQSLQSSGGDGRR